MVCILLCCCIVCYFDLRFFRGLFSGLFPLDWQTLRFVVLFGYVLLFDIVCRFAIWLGVCVVLFVLVVMFWLMGGLDYVLIVYVV